MSERVTMNSSGYEYFKNKLDRSHDGRINSHLGEFQRAADTNEDKTVSLTEAKQFRDQLGQFGIDQKQISKMVNASLGKAKLEAEFVKGETFQVSAINYVYMQHSAFSVDKNRDKKLTTDELKDYVAQFDDDNSDQTNYMYDVHMTREGAEFLEKELIEQTGDPKLAAQMAKEVFTNEKKSRFYEVKPKAAPNP